MTIATQVLTAGALVLLAPLVLIDAAFIAELAAGLSRSGAPKPAQNSDPRATIVIPAHDEAAVIERTLSGLRDTVGAMFEVLVVADNCCDDTAALARRQGATVVERTDAERRGKGFALAFARDWLRHAPPQAVIVLDADCRSDRRSLSNLARRSVETGRAVQAVNLLEAAPDASPMVQISTFAFLIKNLVRQRGLQRLAGAVHLTGTGMALPWHVFDRADLATASIVEDLRLGLELTERGEAPVLAEDSFVWSAHAAHDTTLAQRSRWEGGFLATMRATAPGILARGLRTGSARTLFTGLDLLIPPLALFAMINGATLLLLSGLAAVGLISWSPPAILLTFGIATAIVLLLAWWREGRSTLRFAALLRVPLYALWKLPMYAGLVKKGAPPEWNRTARPGERDQEGGAPSP